MSDQKQIIRQEIKTAIKKHIVKAWYELDPKSYEVWLEGRKAQQRKSISI